MRIANRFERVKPVTNVPNAAAAGIVFMTAACLLAATPGFAQDQRTGVSRPPEVINADPVDQATPPAKPSAAIPMPKTSSETVYGPYVPYRGPGQSAAATPSTDSTPFDPDANIVTETTAGRADRRLLTADAASKSNPDAGIVTHVPLRPGEIPDGTLVKVKLHEMLSTMTTTPGTKFTAEVTEPVMREGKVIVPVGSLLEGRVTWVRGGKRIGGPAAIHLEPRSITLPDGAIYMLRAQVIDTNSWENTKVDSEGTIMRSENTKRNVGVMSLTTGGGMAAGAMMGGVPGALIGAGVGAGVSTVVWLKQDRQAELPKDLGIVFSLTEPMSTTPMSAAAAPVKVTAPGGE
ncbi:MAG TPA: hypothetical protein VF865_12730 [Acidobacteriaceae bacterium]